MVLDMLDVIKNVVGDIGIKYEYAFLERRGGIIIFRNHNANAYLSIPGVSYNSFSSTGYANVYVYMHENNINLHSSDISINTDLRDPDCFDVIDRFLLSVLIDCGCGRRFR